MGYVVQATWTATEESVDAVRDALARLGPLSRQEPGCRLWLAHQEPDRPLVERVAAALAAGTAVDGSGTLDS